MLYNQNFTIASDKSFFYERYTGKYKTDIGKLYARCDFKKQHAFMPYVSLTMVQVSGHTHFPFILSRLFFRKNEKYCAYRIKNLQACCNTYCSFATLHCG